MTYTTGDVIKHLRKRAGMTQDELGSVLGVKRGTIQKYENNTISLGLETIKVISAHFRVLPFVFIYPEVFEPEAILEMEREQLQKILKLNSLGQKKLLEYLEDLYDLDRYRY